MYRINRVFLGLLILLATAGQALATLSPAEEVVIKVSEKVLNTFKQNRAAFLKKPERAFEMAETMVLPYVDINRMASWALGASWRQATPVQKEKFTTEFRQMLVRTYATALLTQVEYLDVTLKLLPSRTDPSGQKVEVRAEARAQGKPPTLLGFRLYQQDNTWKVYDVTVEGISLVTSYRTTFASEVQQLGLDEFIQKLAKRNQEAKM